MTRLLAAVAAGLVALPAAAQPLELKPGDHICIVGNTLAERMQHDGWLESQLQDRFPDHKLTIRNLGFSGDELDPKKRLRSMNFGTPDEWLSGNSPCPQPNDLSPKSQVKANRFEGVGTRADVIFAFFGNNEAWAGEKGLPQFKDDLRAFVKHTLGQKYNGKSAPRLVLFGPTAMEDLKSPNAPPVAEQNARLKLYSEAMKAVATEAKVPFVDLYAITLGAFAQVKERETLNGVHFTESGNQALAWWIGSTLFGAGRDRGPRTYEQLKQLIEAVREKNRIWYQRYRATDGYSTFGARAYLKFTDRQTNYEVVQRELEALDVMVANRDKVIWAAAKGQTLKVDDSNLPPFIPVVTNKPGAGPGGKHLFLSGTDSVKAMTVGKGLSVNLFASEEKFPELVNPVQMAWDAKGRLWVAVWPTYPHWKPTEPMDDKILILEDTDGDGVADTCKTFARGLHNPTGMEFSGKGLLVAQAPDIVYLEDTDGDDKADVFRRVLHGFDTADTHHAANSFALDPGGAVYWQEGTFHHTTVETPYGPPLRNVNGGVYRYEPRTQKCEVYVTFGFANPHGHAFDRWGQDIVVDGTGSNPYHAPLFSGHLPYPQKHSKPPQVYQQRTRPCPGIDFLSSSHFPPAFQGNLLVGNVIGVQGILRYRVDDKGGSFGATELEPMVTSTDPNFRPSDLKTGPDGAVYFLDWHNPIIGHMQHNLRDPSRDREHGRVYRVTHKDRPLAQSPKISGEPVASLLNLLKHPDDPVRRRVRIELAGRDTAEVMTALKAWTAGLSASEPEFEHHRLEALWLHQSHNVVDDELLTRVLKSPDFRARAAAVRVLVAWRDRVPEVLAKLRTLAADAHPRVRLEAVRGASFQKEAEAVEVVLVAQDQPADAYVQHVAGETLRALEPLVREALASGRQLKFATPAGDRYFLRTLSTDDLLKAPKSAGVFAELLLRTGVRDEVRREASVALASARMKPPAAVLLDAFAGATDDSVRYDLLRLLTDRPADLTPLRAEIEKLATGATAVAARQLAFALLVAADGDGAKAFTLAKSAARSLADFAAAVPAVRDPNQRAALYPLVAGLLEKLPAGLEGVPPPKPRYVRISLPGEKKVLSLAEVQVLSGGKNVALRAKTAHSSFQHDGWSSRAVDGVTDGTFSKGSVTHTAEGEANPWWEVDLGSETPVEAVTVWNRTDGKLGQRLDGFTLTLLSADRKPLMERTRLPAPAVKVTIPVGEEDPARAVRRAAMTALASVRGKETETVKLLVPLAAKAEDRAAAVAALQRVPAAGWPAEAAPSLLVALTDYVAKVPAAERTTPAVLDALQLADTAAGLLPKDQAKAARKRLGELGVRVVRVGTLTDQMLFDRDRLVVQAGRPVEFVFENTDIMPHNFVIVRPGALEEVGNQAESFGSQPGALERGYVPPNPKVLLGSRLLQPREGQSLRWQAPSEAGVYPYVCTYPGHWRRMFGALYVVADLDEYLADPEGYLAKNPAPARDELLKYNRPRTEWTAAELAPAVAEGLAGGRSFAHGKQLFSVASCVGCHQFGGEGKVFGPDLAKLDPQRFKTPADLLEHILEPSKHVGDEYRSYTFTLADGGTVTGLVVKKSADSYEVVENPLVKVEPRVIKASDLDGPPKPSPTSQMPKGLLDKLTKDEILDLLAYVWGKADPKDKAFGGGHKH